MQICLNCNKEFAGGDKNHIYKFCSKSCANKSRIGEISKRRKPRIDRMGYWYLYLPDHPHSGKQGYVAEHRIVIEQELGRLLTAEEVAHHRDGDRKNNHIDNLELFSSRGQHSKIAHPRPIDNKGRFNPIP